MNTQIHFIAQYLAMAGKSFLPRKEDDSHTNIGFNVKDQSFETWNLGEDDLKLVFNLPNFELKWSMGTAFELNGKNHSSVLEWLKSSSKDFGLEGIYTFEPHYDLPFDWNDDFTFNLKNRSPLTKEIKRRTLANNTLEAFLRNKGLKADIRVWPHHFDTGAFINLDDGSGKSIGLGMAIPDTLMDDHYFYISGYQGHDAIATTNFDDLNLGKWNEKGFEGAILPIMNSNENQALGFFEQAFDIYLKA